MALRYRILAGTYEQARHLADRMRLDISEWGYVPSEESLLGQRHGVMLCYGTWRHRTDLTEVMTRARVNEFNLLEVS